MADEVDRIYVPLGELVSQEVWPSDFFGSADFSFLDLIAYVDGQIFDDDLGTNISLQLEVMADVVFDLPFTMAIIVGSGPVDFMLTGDDLGFTSFTDLQLLKLRLPRALFVPVLPGTSDPDPDLENFAEITLPARVNFDSHGNFDIIPPASGGTAINLDRCMIGNTGVIISASGVQVRFSDNESLPDEAAAAGIGDDFRGVFIGTATVELPKGLDSAVPSTTELSFKNCFIGTGGFTGRLQTNVGAGASTELFGAQFTFQSLTVDIKQNALTAFQITGKLKLPFFDTPLDVVVGIDLDGLITIQVSQAGGLLVLEVANVFKLTVDKLELDVDVDSQELTVHTSGTLQPTFDPGGSLSLQWPGIRVEDLAIDSQGHVRIAGGWIDLPTQVTLDLFGFQLEITRLGFGKTDEGENWIGFNGALRLLEGVPAGASVDGLRILWGLGSTHMELAGIGVSLEIPGVLKISGHVALATSDNPEFRGAVRVELPAISFEVDGTFVAGTVLNGQGQPVIDPETNRPLKTYAVYLQMQLPVGIPLGPSGLAFYGLAGLYAHNREPDKDTDEGWYRGPNLEDGWYTRAPEGITDVGAKWKGSKGHTGFGAGIIIGTFPDNGYMFNGRLLLALVFPGPIILIEGMANLFRKRTSLGSDGVEPNFRALIVIDPGQSFTAGLDAQYKFASAGELLDIRGSARAFFGNDGQWSIDIGVKDPASNRVRARAFQLFDVNAYFMLHYLRDEKNLQVGAGWGIHKVYGFKHLNVTLAASMEGGAVLSWHPAHLNGSITVAGSASLRAFSISAGLSVSARLSADVFDPFGISGSFRVSLNLPWPLPDIHKSISMSWRSSSTDPPQLPVPLRAASIEHIKSGNSWPLAGGASLLGELAFETAGVDGSNAPSSELQGPFAPNAVPSIPSDAQVAVTFTRPMDDPNKISLYLVGVQADIVGDPQRNRVTYTVGYSLQTLDLQKWAPGDKDSADGVARWVTVRQGLTDDDKKQLSATWQPGTEDPDENHSEQNKLFVNAVTPFDYTAERSKAWQDWFLSTHPGFPCPLAVPELSARFEQPIGTQLSLPFHFVDPDPAFTVDWVYGGQILDNDVVTSTVLGPIDRGLVAAWATTNMDDNAHDFLFEVTPPAGKENILIRLGSPASAFRKELSFRPTGTAANPFLSAGSPAGTYTAQTFNGLGSSFSPASQNTIDEVPHFGPAIDIADRIEITPPQPALYIELVIVTSATAYPPFEAFTVDTNGVESTHRPVASGESAMHFRCDGATLLARLVVRRLYPTVVGTSPRAHISRVSSRGPVLARAFSTAGPPQDFTEPLDGLLHVNVPGLTKVRLLGQAHEGISMLEMALPADDDALVRHVQSSLSRLTGDDPLFEPDNDYRLVVSTKREAKAGPDQPGVLTSTTDFVHHAYFHVVAPPGVGTPDQPPDQPAASATGNIGLGDLRLYVEQTLPPTIPAEGEKLLLPRAFYRSYDVGVHFNAPYTELMYLTARRALTVRLYDVDDNPILGKDGRVSIPTPSWERSRQQSLRDAVTTWVGAVNGSDCRPDDLPPLDDSDITRNQALASPDEDVVLAPETLHQARLVPALLHETFIDPLPNLVADGGPHRLERWVAENLGAITPAWRIDSEEFPPDPTDPDGKPAVVFFVTDDSGGTSSLLYAGALGLRATSDAPGSWSDFRASVRLRWASGVVGLDLRRGGGAFIRLTLDRNGDVRRLASVSGGTPTALAPDVTTPAFPADGATDVVITVECVGDRVLVLQEGVGDPIFDVPGAPTAPGTIALHVANATGVRFTEVHVDDLRQQPASAFVFDFVTSKYTNFHHHLHSFADTIADGAPATALSAADLATAAAAAVAVPAPGIVLGAVGDPERRAFDAVESRALGQAALRPAESLEILRVSVAGAPTALMVRSPEPILWDRVQLEVSTSADPAPFALPGDVKLTDVAFGDTFSNQVVTILVRAKSDLSGHRLELRQLPVTSDTEPPWTPYFTFGQDLGDYEDGTQVRLFGPPESGVDPPQREPGTVQLFLPGDAPTTLRFASPGIELRLVAPDRTTVLHGRRFLSPDGFAAFPMQIVRKLDGTAALLFVTAGAAPTAMRLRWTFIRAFDDEKLPFRQGGSVSAESAVLDFVLPVAV